LGPLRDRDPFGGVTTIIKMHRDLDGYEADAFEAEIAGAESRAQIDFCSFTWR
jgi:hypothetical protein